MDTRDYILMRLKQRIQEVYSGPKGGWSNAATKTSFLQKCYQQWAANEFLDYLTKQGPNLYASAQAFVDRMDDYACKSHVPNRWMFSVAYDVAVELQDYMYTV